MAGMGRRIPDRRYVGEASSCVMSLDAFTANANAGGARCRHFRAVSTATGRSNVLWISTTESSRTARDWAIAKPHVPTRITSAAICARDQVPFAAHGSSPLAGMKLYPVPEAWLRPLKNHEIADVFYEIADLLEMAGTA